MSQLHQQVLDLFLHDLREAQSSEDECIRNVAHQAKTIYSIVEEVHDPKRISDELRALANDALAVARHLCCVRAPVLRNQDSQKLQSFANRLHGDLTTITKCVRKDVDIILKGRFMGSVRRVVSLNRGESKELDAHREILRTWAKNLDLRCSGSSSIFDAVAVQWIHPTSPSGVPPLVVPRDQWVPSPGPLPEPPVVIVSDEGPSPTRSNVPSPRSTNSRDRSTLGSTTGSGTSSPFPPFLVTPPDFPIHPGGPHSQEILFSTPQTWIYRGKINWGEHAVHEAITVIFPRVYGRPRVGDPVIVAWQWSQDTKRNVFANAPIDTVIMEERGEVRIEFHKRKPYHFEGVFTPSNDRGAGKLTLKMLDQDNCWSDPTVLTNVYAGRPRPGMAGTRPSFFYGKMDLAPFATNEAILIVFPKGLGDEDVFSEMSPGGQHDALAFWEWTRDLTGEVKKNAQVIDRISQVGVRETALWRVFGSMERTHYTFECLVEGSQPRTLSLTIKNRADKSYGPFLLCEEIVDFVDES